MNKNIRRQNVLLMHCLIILIICGCKEKKNPCNLPASVLTKLALLDSLVHDPVLREKDSLWNENNYKEPPLFSAQHETYRFVWHSAFGEAKVCRIWHSENSFTVTLKKIIDNEDNPETSQFSISEKTWNNIVDSLSILGFWTYSHPSQKPMMDADFWKLEGYKQVPDACTGKNYQYISGFSPVDNGFRLMYKLLDRLDEPVDR